MMRDSRMNIGGPAGPGNKRGRTELDEDNTQRTKRRRVKTDEFFTSEVMQSTKLIGLEIIESDPRGHLVAVQNHTTQVRFTLESKSCITCLG